MSGLIRSMRPRQWVKNGVVLAALVFARQGDRLGSLLRALAAMALFSLLASGVYLFNDLLDRERDRLHPKKRFRPIAAGTVSPVVAGSAALVLAVGSVGLSFWLAPRFGIVALAYLVLQVLYSTWLKHLVLLDVFAIAAGFVLRVVAGAVVIAVPISNWLYLCTLLLALFLACAKRRAELLAFGDGDPAHHRRSLAHYSVGLLDQMIGILAACTILAYSLYTLSSETQAKFGTDSLKYTIPFVIFGLFRYLYLVHQRNQGESPEKVLLTDIPLLLDIGVFLGVVVVVLY
jgi:4-hydroxybenzoate polyprenyltransferase